MLFAVLLAMAAQVQDAKCDVLREAALQEEARNATSARQFALAAKRWEEVITACPANSSALFALAEVRAAAKEYDAAIRAAIRYLEREPASVPGRILLAGAYLMARQPKEALAESERMLKKHSAEPAALKIKGNSAYLLGDTSTAITTFISLLDRHPGDDEGAYMLGRIYYQEGQVDLALGQFERALKINPASYKALDNLGLCHMANGDNEKAMRYFLGAVKLVEKDHPEYEWPYINIADLLLKQNDPRRAFDAASKAANRNPMSPRAFYFGAKALQSLDKTEQSLNWAQRAVALDPDYSNAWYLISRLYQKLGQDANAKEAREKFLAARAKEPARRK
jgi:tetratricopeptide (TPR) repeat protein